MIVAVLSLASARFINVNAVVMSSPSPVLQHKSENPGVTDGVYDGVLMKMTDISYSNLDAYVGDTLGQIGVFTESGTGPSGIYQQIRKVNGLDWHLSSGQADQKFFSDLNNWKIVDVENREPSDGFYAVAFEQGNTVVIAYRGTDDVQDLVSDAGIYLDIQSSVAQLRLAQQFASNVRKSLPSGSYHVIFTGHSIGGWMAQQLYLDEVGNTNSWQAVSATVFNSIGTGFRPNSIDGFNVKDYHLQGDIFSHFGTSLGQEIDVPNKLANESVYDKHQMYNFYGYFYPVQQN